MFQTGFHGRLDTSCAAHHRYLGAGHGELKLVGARYDLDDGKVDFFNS